jgi:dihydrofolate reductase
MARVIYNTATTLNGFLADDAELPLLAVRRPRRRPAESDFSTFPRGVGALVMGSTTYEWILDHENLVEHPEKWFYPRTSRASCSPRVRCLRFPGADIRFPPW